MKRFFVVLLSLTFLVGCAGGGQRELPPTGSGEKISGPILIQADPVIRPGAAATNVLNECTAIGTKLADCAVERYAPAKPHSTPQMITA